MRARDLGWEKLVEVTQANPDFERGQLNKALASIRACCERDGLLAEDVPAEIEARAALYRETFPGLTLTPTALARHWYRVLPQADSGPSIDKWREKYGG